MTALVKCLCCLGWLIVLLVLAPSPALACATCFGDSDSDMAKGMKMGVLSLLAVVVFVLAGFAAFFVFLVRRSSLADASVPPATATIPSSDIILK